MSLLPNLFAITGKKELAPRFALEELEVSNARRPLTTREVQQCKNSMVIATVTFADELDPARTARVVRRLQRLYPFLDSAVVYDPEREWLRFEPQEPHDFDFSKPGFEMTDLQDFSAYTQRTDQVTGPEKLSHFELIRVDIPDVPYHWALGMCIAHFLGDGSMCVSLASAFNRLYLEDAAAPLEDSEDIEPIQRSTFSPLAAFPIDRISLESQPPVTRGKLTQLNAFFKYEKMSVCEQLVFRYKKEDYFARFPGVQFTNSMQSVVLATYAAYAYATKSLPRTENFSVGASDVRRMYRFFEEEGRIEDLDLTRTLGLGVCNYSINVDGNTETTLKEFFDIFQREYEQFATLTPEERWRRFLPQEYAPILDGVGSMTHNVLVSNIGKCDLGEGPLQQYTGATSYHVEFPALYYVYGSFNSHCGPLGILSNEFSIPAYSKERQREDMRLMIEVSHIAAAEGPEAVTVGRIADMLEESLASIPLK